MRRRLALPAVLLVALTASAAPVPKEWKRLPDAERLVGEWKLVEWDVGSGYGLVPYHPSNPIRIEKFRSGDIDTRHDDMPDDQRPRFFIDPTATPKRIDNGGRAGIYEIDGDTLHWCMAVKSRTSGDAGDYRPTEFKGVDDHQWHFVYKRVKE